MLRWAFALVLVGCWFGVALAEDPPPPPAAPTIVTGRVTDVLGRPVPDARVYVLPRRGQPTQTKTNKEGRYSVQVPGAGTHGVVLAIGKAHTFRTVLVKRGVTNELDIDAELDIHGGEVIKIEDKKRPQPTVKPKPTGDPRASLPYSDEAVERDAWARAWLLLDIDERGAVTRLKMLKKPGFALERICIQKAFELRFTPALDDKGHPMKTYVLWTMEWPSWGWLVQGNGTAVHRPNDADEMHQYAQNIEHGTTGKTVEHTDEGPLIRPIGGAWSRPLPSGVSFPHALARVPCAGSGPLNLDLRNRAYRDCSQADMSRADALPWITRDTAETAIVEMMAPELMLVDETRRAPNVPGYISLGVTGTLFAATVASYLVFDRAEDRVLDKRWQLGTFPEEYARERDNMTKWGKISIGLAMGTIAAAGITVVIWNRHQSPRSFSVQPTTTGSGAGALLSTSW